MAGGKAGLKIDCADSIFIEYNYIVSPERKLSMKHVSIIVRAAWDAEASVWVATSADIDGLAVEADTIEALEPKVVSAISDLLEMNEVSSDLRKIPVHILSEQFARVPNPYFR
ncbi:hypothetical protein QO002_001614 [Pararhizobium capsulatum DSM 1112]|uniref:DUF1902 domain-containing protein n=1 Tax=Pararhizobium capsulatum DSM 1112 TaxID=1121113 RepID=A0ABU0BP77_9HYPH|nr:DUF1902 domain-containing protein [Pararhizobium capsulatum]MDQ0319476.1 hypothetical protein [Pararhizobium capsulatum DSM 1112]